MPLFNRSDGPLHYEHISRVNSGLANKFFLFTDSTGVTRSSRISNLFASITTPAAVGGTESVITGGGLYYRVHQFTSNGSLTFSRETSVEALLVGGGGAGGGVHAYGCGGGGGAGQVIELADHIVAAGEMQLTIGQGGAGIVDRGNSGGATSAFGLTAIGGVGGGGRKSYINTDDPGSGGGVANFYQTDPYNLVATGVNANGFRAGNANKAVPINAAFCSSGGAGSAANGGDAYSDFSQEGSYGGNGGDGVASSITGVQTYYAGGGAGTIRQNGVPGIGGLGGGADGVGGYGVTGARPGGGCHRLRFWWFWRRHHCRR